MRYRLGFVVFAFVGLFSILFFTRFDAISWNDRSRFSTIEAIVETHSFAIDNTNFATGDKIKVGNHFYSDKPPVFSVFAAIPYALFRLVGIPFFYHPAFIIYNTNLFALTLPFILYLVFLYLFAKKYWKIPHEQLVFFIVCLGLGTVCFPFTTQLNNHLPAAVAAGCATLLFLFSRYTSKKLFLAGFLLSLGITFDLSVVFITFFFTLFFLFQLYQQKGLPPKEKIYLFLAYCAGAIIPVCLHVILNQGITGDIWPGSMHPEFFNYPGSEFTSANLTASGTSVHSVREWISYVFFMTFGQRGFFLHNPLLLLGGFVLIMQFIKEKSTSWRVFLVATFFSIVSVILYYSLYGREAGGGAYTVRWFVVFVPLFFPIILQWLAASSPVKIYIFSIVFAISFFINILPMGNILGGANHKKQYHILNMWEAFPVYAVSQWYTWGKFLH